MAEEKAGSKAARLREMREQRYADMQERGRQQKLAERTGKQPVERPGSLVVKKNEPVEAVDEDEGWRDLEAEARAKKEKGRGKKRG